IVWSFRLPLTKTLCGFVPQRKLERKTALFLLVVPASLLLQEKSSPRPLQSRMKSSPSTPTSTWAKASGTTSSTLLRTAALNSMGKSPVPCRQQAMATPNKRAPVLGILGGMGPAATAEFYRLLV